MPRSASPSFAPLLGLATLLGLSACNATRSDAPFADETGETSTDDGADTSTDETGPSETEDGEASEGATEDGATEDGETEGSETEGGETEDGETADANLRPEDAPDWLVIAVSGHCIPPGCEVPGVNHEYLETHGTPQRFTDTLEAWGYSTELWSYSDELYNRDLATNELLPGEGNPAFFGFLQLHQDLEFVRDQWVAEFDNPTKLLVIAHSHGVVWAHTALHVVDVPVEVLISLDGKSLGWESEDILLDFGDDWAAEIHAHANEHQIMWPFDIANAEGGWNIPGQGSMDVEDVIPNSVAHNLEIQAIPGLIMPFPDADDNRRLDGGQIGISIFRSNIEDHSEVDDSHSQAINWALTQFGQLAN